MIFNLRRFFKNVSYLFTANIISSLILFFQGVLLIRYLGSEQYGVWSISRSLPAMFYVITDLGLNSLILREIAFQPNRERINRFFTNGIILKGFLSLLFFLVLGIFLLIFKYPASVSVLILLAAITFVATTFNEIIVVIFKAQEIFKWQAFHIFLRTCGVFVVVLCNILLNSGLFIIWTSISIFHIGLLIGFIVAARNYVQFDFHTILALSELWRLVQRAFPFALIGIMSGFFLEIDIVMLSKLANFSDVGIFNAANRLISALIMFPLYFGHVLFPSFSYYFKNKPDEFTRLVLRFEKYVIILIFPLCAILYKLADQIVLFLFGRGYINSIIPLKILSLSFLFNFFSVVFIQSLNASESEKRVALLFSGAVGLKLVLNFFLVPQYTYIGASISAVSGEFFRFIGAFSFFAIHLKYRIKFESISTYSLVLLPLIFFLYPWPRNYSFFVLLVALMLYVWLLFKKQLLSKQELLSIWRRMANRHGKMG